MNKLCAGTLLAGLCVFAMAGRQVLSPSARILVNGLKQGIPAVKLDSKNRTMKVSDEKIVGAYIMLNDENAIGPLESLGVKLRHNHGLFYTASIPIEVLEQVGAMEGVEYISVGNRVNLLNDYNRRICGVDEVHSNKNSLLPDPFTGKGVVVGVIDLGIEYNHPAYRDAEGNLRIKSVWNQRNSRGTPPGAFGYGTEYTLAEELRNAAYDTAQEFHGGHTTGTAAGSDRNSLFYGVAPDADIVFVSLDQENSTGVADAIKYIFNYADKVGKPCVINMSLGDHIGPHNGTSPLDQVIDDLVGPGRIIVGACGNEGEVRLHASETFTSEDRQLKSMLTKAENTQHNMHYIDVWGTDSSDIKVSLCVVNALKGNILYQTKSVDTSVEDSRVFDLIPLAEHGIAANVLIEGERNPLNGQPHVQVQCQVTEINTGRLMGIIVEGEEGQTVNMWSFGSNEFSSNGKRGWTDGTTEGTVGEIGGTAKRIITVGAYDARERLDWVSGGYSLVAESGNYEQGKRSVFSSCGPTADGRTVPHVLAGGNPVVSAFNKYYLTTMGATQEQIDYATNGVSKGEDGISYYYIYNIGTSMSAPFVAGTVALMLEANPDLSPEDVREIIMSNAIQEDFMGTLPNNQYGSGKINTLECVKKAVSFDSGAEIPVSDSMKERTRVWTEKSSVCIAFQDSENGTAGIYSVSGQYVGSFSLNHGMNTIDASGWGHGVFVARIGQHTFKVVL